MRCLEADPPVDVPGDPAHDRALHLDELDPLDLAPGLRVAEVGEQQRALGLDEQHRVRALEPGEVPDVDGGGDEKRLLEQLAQTIEAVHVPSTR